MGLGKTVELIALLVHAANIPIVDANDSPKCTLIFCPSNLVTSWSDHCSGFVNPPLPHFNCDQNLTSDILVKIINGEIKIVIVSTSRITISDNDVTTSLLKIRWDRVVVDEAHVINSGQGPLNDFLLAIESRSRWFLTGTPVVCLV